MNITSFRQYTFGTNGNARLAKQDAYTVIDGVNIDFVINVGEVEDTAEGAVLTLKTNKVGAKITSTRVLHHGKITFEIQTAWSGGVVTAAVLMGDATEEVDFEFTGNTLKTVQSNIFSWVHSLAINRLHKRITFSSSLAVTLGASMIRTSCLNWFLTILRRPLRSVRCRLILANAETSPD